MVRFRIDDRAIYYFTFEATDLKVCDIDSVCGAFTVSVLNAITNVARAGNRPQSKTPKSFCSNALLEWLSSKS